MLDEVVTDFISKGNTTIVGPTGNGITSLTLHFINCLLTQNKLVLYYNPTKEIDTDFVKKFYPRVYKNVLFYMSDLTTLLDFLSYIEYEIDYMVIDPGDTMMVDKNIIPLLVSILRKKGKHLLMSSQIRQDPNNGGKVYSPLEKLNISYNNELFDWSIWVRDVTDVDDLFKSRYVDIFEKIRVGNRYIRRYITKFSIKEGNVIA
jgi:hypothetical protein